MNFSGSTAWWLWRTIYPMKLPRFERNVRVAFDWTLDRLFTKDLVQCPTARAVPVAVLRDAAVHAASEPPSELRAAS